MSSASHNEGETPQSSSSGPHISYMVRRETHSSRATVSVIVAIVTIAAMVYIAIEGIMGMLGYSPLLVSWTQMVEFVASLPDHLDTVALIATGAGIAIIGLILVLKAITPGPLSRHSLTDNRSAYVIDDAVIASAISREAREYAGLGDGQVTTSVGRKKVRVTLVPTSGIPLNIGDITAQLQEKVDAFNLKPELSVKVVATQRGVVAK